MDMINKYNIEKADYKKLYQELRWEQERELSKQIKVDIKKRNIALEGKYLRDADTIYKVLCGIGESSSYVTALCICTDLSQLLSADYRLRLVGGAPAYLRNINGWMEEIRGIPYNGEYEEISEDEFIREYTKVRKEWKRLVSLGGRDFAIAAGMKEDELKGLYDGSDSEI